MPVVIIACIRMSAHSPTSDHSAAAGHVIMINYFQSDRLKKILLSARLSKRVFRSEYNLRNIINYKFEK